MGAVADRAAGRSEILGPGKTDVGLGRLDVGGVGGGLGARRAHGNHVYGQVALAGLGQKLLDHLLGFGIVALAEEVVADLALGVDEIIRRPIFIVERAPDRIIVVDRDRIVDLELGDGLFDV